MGRGNILFSRKVILGLLLISALVNVVEACDGDETTNFNLIPNEVIIYHVLPHLDIPTRVALMSTCRRYKEFLEAKCKVYRSVMQQDMLANLPLRKESRMLGVIRTRPIPITFPLYMKIMDPDNLVVLKSNNRIWDEPISLLEKIEDIIDDAMKKMQVAANAKKLFPNDERQGRAYLLHAYSFLSGDQIEKFPDSALVFGDTIDITRKMLLIKQWADAHP